MAVQQVFVCTNRWCMQRGAGATMGSFIGLTPFGSKLRVQGVDCLGRCNKGPNIRILRSNGSFEELSYIDSVDKVYDVFTNHLAISLNQSAADWCVGGVARWLVFCRRLASEDEAVPRRGDGWSPAFPPFTTTTTNHSLKLNFQGNAHLDKNEVDQAIECYDKAIPLSHKGQEGVLRVMRSTAYLQRAYTHFMQFRVS